MWNDIDTNKSGDLDYAEFSRFCARPEMGKVIGAIEGILFEGAGQQAQQSPAPTQAAPGEQTIVANCLIA